MATETLRPNAAGDETSITSQWPNSTFHWDKVDEAVADDGSTTVRTTSSTYKRDLYNLPASSGSGTINKITVYFRCSSEVYGNGARASIKSNSTVTDGAEKNFVSITTWYDFSQEWATNPADSQAWEWADIDALQIGVSLKGDGTDLTDCTQVYVVVDYTAATNVEIAVPLADTIDTTGIVPTLVRDMKPAIPLATIDSAGLVPGFVRDMKPAIPLTTIDSAGLVPGFVRDMKPDIPLTTVDGVGIVPALALDVKPNIPLATIDAAMLVPTFVLDMKPDVPLSTVDIASLVPALKLDRIFDIPLATVTSEGLAPTIIEGLGVLIDIPLATIAGEGLTPSLVLDVKPAIPLATVDSEGIAPALVLDVILSIPLALIDTAHFAPSLALGTGISIPLAEITVTGLDGEFYFTPNRILSIFLQAIAQALSIESTISQPLTITSNIGQALTVESTITEPLTITSTISQPLTITSEIKGG